ncbi:MAG TPA: sulfurtransferase-like selenium metabolism protein YedF [Nitrospirota bacterium]|nr:sulfurtransferase-like selenium metabolism protein YedF [Nitrospirota bacterium]
MLIDARGQGCPKPVMMADEALSKMQEGIVEVLVDNEESALNVAGFAAQNEMFAETKKEGNDWRVKIVKGYSCKVQSSEFNVQNIPESGTTGQASKAQTEPAGHRKTLLLVVGSDIMGREEELGKTLMKAFFETMKVYKQLPHTIFFLNTGVYLTTVNKEISELLKAIHEMGVEIYSCGTCLTKYNLEGQLSVGNRGTMNIVVEGMQDFEKTVWM